MKLYKKKNLTFSNGMLVTKKNKVVNINVDIVDQANYLETLSQKLAWLKEQPKSCSGPDFGKFKRMHSGTKVKLDTETPTLDKEVEKSLKLMDEIDHYNTTEQAESIINKEFKELVEFVNNKEIINSYSHVSKFDTPTLGNPLELTNEDIIRIVVEAVEAGLIRDLYQTECNDVLPIWVD